MPDRDIEARLKDKPDRPEDPEEPPPDMPEPEFDDVDVDLEAVSIAAPSVSSELDIGIGGLAVAEGEYLPIVKPQPLYPRRALERGVEGWCIVSYTVTTTGATKDVVVVDAQPKGMFNNASIKAAQKFKYKPRVENGVAIEVKGVQNKFTFALEK